MDLRLRPVAPAPPRASDRAGASHGRADIARPRRDGSPTRSISRPGRVAAGSASVPGQARRPNAARCVANPSGRVRDPSAGGLHGTPRAGAESTDQGCRKSIRMRRGAPPAGHRRRRYKASPRSSRAPSAPGQRRKPPRTGGSNSARRPPHRAAGIHIPRKERVRGPRPRMAPGRGETPPRAPAGPVTSARRRHTGIPPGRGDSRPVPIAGIRPASYDEPRSRTRPCARTRYQAAQIHPPGAERGTAVCGSRYAVPGDSMTARRNRRDAPSRAERHPRATTGANAQARPLPRS